MPVRSVILSPLMRNPGEGGSHVRPSVAGVTHVAGDFGFGASHHVSVSLSADNWLPGPDEKS